MIDWTEEELQEMQHWRYGRHSTVFHVHLLLTAPDLSGTGIQDRYFTGIKKLLIKRYDEVPK